MIQYFRLVNQLTLLILLSSSEIRSQRTGVESEDPEPWCITTAQRSCLSEAGEPMLPPFISLVNANSVVDSCNVYRGLVGCFKDRLKECYNDTNQNRWDAAYRTTMKLTEKCNTTAFAEGAKKYTECVKPLVKPGYLNDSQTDPVGKCYLAMDMKMYHVSPMRGFELINWKNSTNVNVFCAEYQVLHNCTLNEISTKCSRDVADIALNMKSFVDSICNEVLTGSRFGLSSSSLVHAIEFRLAVTCLWFIFLLSGNSLLIS